MCGTTRGLIVREIAPSCPPPAATGIYGDLSLPEACSVSRGVFGNDPAFCLKYRPNHDPEKARALLKKLGYGPGQAMSRGAAIPAG
ncbi:hypothetical protein [Ancylobacter lacus]|uniref:hypothetical protein n=1 Tax=Ancylobacter lacus TaxID=2579970 RepID=UPI001BCD0FC6|nr:hypothetical protein [Ancylobacter lacus]MBS7537350.1 hypothetical protein [Ancylobacter lacus]